VTTDGPLPKQSAVKRYALVPKSVWNARAKLRFAFLSRVQRRVAVRVENARNRVSRRAFPKRSLWNESEGESA